MSNTENNKDKSQFQLLGKKRFGPFFLTQFLGAFNDNVFRYALLTFISFQASQSFSTDDINRLNNIAAALFILPFFLFSATSGQIADKLEKSMLIRRIKLLEIAIMILAAVAFYYQNIYLLIALLFLTGTQSTLFAPVKYSILPQHLRAKELVGGVGLTEMGTFVAILTGTIIGTEVVSLDNGIRWAAGLIIVISVLGWLASRKIPYAQAAEPSIKINPNIVKQIWKNIQFARRDRVVFLSILGISWFWFLGISYITQMPNFTKEILHSAEGVFTILLAMFSLGIAAGSLLCERLSDHKVEIGLVPLGSIGLSIFGIDLFLSYETPIAIANTTELMTRSEFLASTGSFRLLIDLFFIGVFGGFYSVPLYALIQSRTEERYRARVIAANDIFNALLMVCSTGLSLLLLTIFDFTIPQLFLVIAFANILVAIYIYSLVPEFLIRFLIWILSHTMYRVTHKHLHFIPDDGPAVLVCNHVSYVDALLLGGACRRPIRFVMHESYYNIPVLKFIFRTGKAIPIASQKERPKIYQQAFDQIAQALTNGDLVCIFPEGKLTTTGNIDTFKPGIEKIIQRTPVPIIPIALCGLWGSFFSHKVKPAMKKWPTRFWSKLTIIVGKPLAPEIVTAEKLHTLVSKLRANNQ